MLKDDAAPGVMSRRCRHFCWLASRRRFSSYNFGWLPPRHGINACASSIVISFTENQYALSASLVLLAQGEAGGIVLSSSSPASKIDIISIRARAGAARASARNVESMTVLCEAASGHAEVIYVGSLGGGREQRIWHNETSEAGEGAVVAA